jgi:phage shock protein PspC (stress-responsive transcriptional regulator)
MSDTPTPPEKPDEPQPVSSGDPLGSGAERPDPEPPREDPPTAATQPMAAGPQPRRLTRSSSDRVLGGVAGGLGRYFDIDPIIFRIGFVVLALAGGAGVLGYIAAWVLVPAAPVAGEEPADRSRAATIVGAIVLALAALVLIGPGLFFLAPPLIGIALVGLVGVLLWRAAGGPEGGGSAAARIGLGLLLLVVAFTGFVAVAVGAAAGGGAVIAGLVIALGAALTVSAFLGGRRWLVLPALILAIPLGFVAAAGIDVDGGVGDRDYQPTSIREMRDGYELGMGELRLDLTQVDLPPGRTPLKLDIGIGSLRVIVPDDVCVASDVRVGAGYARVLDRDSGGLDVDWRRSPVDNGGVKRLVIDGDVGIGELQVVNNRSEFTDWEHDDRIDDRFDENFRLGGNRSDLIPDAGDANVACTEAA